MHSVAPSPVKLGAILEKLRSPAWNQAWRMTTQGWGQLRLIGGFHRFQELHDLTLGRRDEFALPHHFAPSDERPHGPAGNAHAVVGRPAGAGRDPTVGDYL